MSGLVETNGLESGLGPFTSRATSERSVGEGVRRGPAGRESGPVGSPRLVRHEMLPCLPDGRTSPATECSRLRGPL